MRDDADDIDTLRRRIYSPASTPADLERYRAITEPLEVVPAATPGVADRPPTASLLVEPRRRPRRLLTAVVVVVALIAGGGAWFVGWSNARRPVPLIAPVVVAADAGTRAELEEELARGEVALSAWFVSHPRLTQLRDATRFTTVEATGTGSRTVPLTPMALGDEAGRATVLLVLRTGTKVTWTAVAADRADGLPAPVHVRGGTQQAGVLTAATLRYAEGARPTALRVRVRDGVQWAAAVVYSD